MKTSALPILLYILHKDAILFGATWECLEVILPPRTIATCYINIACLYYLYSKRNLAFINRRVSNESLKLYNNKKNVGTSIISTKKITKT